MTTINNELLIILTHTPTGTGNPSHKGYFFNLETQHWAPCFAGSGVNDTPNTGRMLGKDLSCYNVFNNHRKMVIMVKRACDLMPLPIFDASLDCASLSF